MSTLNRIMSTLANEFRAEPNPQKLVERLRGQLASSPGDAGVRQKLASLLAETGDRDGAISEYVKLQEQLAEDGDVLGAISAGLKVMELDPKIENPLAYIARIKLDSLREAHDQKEAEAELEKVIAPLQQVPLLSDLTPEELSSVAPSMKRHELGADGVVFHEGDEGDSIYFVHTGTLEATRGDSRLGLLEPGHCFGEFSFLTSKPRTATVRVRESCEILELSAEKMRGVVESYPRVRDVLFEMFRARALANVLAASPLFATLPPEERSELAERFQLVRLPEGQFAIREGEHDGTIYLIKEGSVEVHARIGGESVALARLGRHQFVGEVSFLTGVPRTASVRALEDTELLQIDEPELRNLISRHPEMEAVLKRYHLDRVTATADALKAFMKSGRVEGLVS